MIDKERLIGQFITLTRFDCESFSETEIADYLSLELKKLGLIVSEDKVLPGEKCSGNIFAYLPATPGFEDRESILLSSHMATVKPGIAKKAVRHPDGRITSDGTTVLGADDAAGLAEILEVLKVIKEDKPAHGRIEVVFFAAEEPYGRGSAAFDPSVLKAGYGYVLDLTGKVGTAAICAPTIIDIEIKIKGKSAHAGFAPEDGINALSIAAKALSETECGRIGDATVNFGLINGGIAKNIVPGEIVVGGEIRSTDDAHAEKLAREIEKRFNDEAEKAGGSAEITIEKKIKAYNIDKNEKVVKHFLSAAKEAGLQAELVTTYGGSDANNINTWNIPTIVLACAMMNVHTTSEYTEEDEMVKAAELVLSLIK